MHKTFKEWKDALQKEHNKLAAIGDMGRRSLVLTFLYLADWSNSAADVVEWIDGKHELAEDHLANLQRPDAEPIILEIRRIADAEAKGNGAA